MTEELWRAAEIAAATGGEARGDWAVAGVSIDSRTVQRGELFIALRGPNHDGHAFVSDALARGAAALVDRVPDDLGEQASLVLVGDTMVALTALGQAARRRTRARIAALTGSVGKTGTKEALRLVLAAQAPTHASAGSHNNHWGVPLSLARAPRDTVYGIYELGMNAPGEIASLTRLVRPHVAMITTVEAAHLGFFTSVDAIAEAKGEIFQGIEPAGVAILNADNTHYARLRTLAEAAGCARVIGFGATASAAARLSDARLDTAGSEVVMTLQGREIAFRIGAPGRHWVKNALGVIACAAALGADPEAAARALTDFRAPAGRGQQRRVAVPGGAITLIDDSYNANPASVRAALDVLGSAAGRKLAALGDMLELGDHAPRLHADLASPIATSGIDRVYTAGPGMRHLHEALPVGRRGVHVDDAAKLLPVIEAELQPGDTLLVKGSLGMRMGQIVQALVARAEPAEPTRRVAGRRR
jgi:UDP-N-acetylmuramoyl-tripeptide--D-alanyl-D-alanine ligase